MTLIARNNNPGKLTQYKHYKPHLRLNFCHTCVYCSIHESEHGGLRSFGVEHHKPKKPFPELELDYDNLLYSCNVCGSFKGHDWPSDDPVGAGKGYINPCDHDFAEHFELQIDGEIKSKSAVGEYMKERLHLNRHHAVRIRYYRLKFEREYPNQISKFEKMIELVEKQIRSEGPVNEFEEILEWAMQAKRELEGRQENRWAVYQPEDYR